MIDCTLVRVSSVMGLAVGLGGGVVIRPPVTQVIVAVVVVLIVMDTLVRMLLTGLVLRLPFTLGHDPCSFRVRSGPAARSLSG